MGEINIQPDMIVCKNVSTILPSSWKPLFKEIKNLDLCVDLIKVCDGGQAFRAYKNDCDFLMTFYVFESPDKLQLELLPLIISFYKDYGDNVVQRTENKTILFQYDSDDGGHACIYSDYSHSFAFCYESDACSWSLVHSIAGKCKVILNS